MENIEKQEYLLFDKSRKIIGKGTVATPVNMFRNYLKKLGKEWYTIEKAKSGGSLKHGVTVYIMEKRIWQSEHLTDRQKHDRLSSCRYWAKP